LWAVLFAHGIGEGLRTGRGWLRMNVSSAPDAHAYPVVLGAGPWKELEPGDRLEAVEGEDLLGSSAARVFDRVTRAARERGFASVRASRSGVPFETRLGLTPVPWWWTKLLFTALVFLVGLLLLVRAPEWHLARRNFVLFFCLGAMGASSDWNRSGFRGTWLEVNLGWLVMIFTVGLFLWNAQECIASAADFCSGRSSP
jgi:hypothetical protein